MYCDQCIVVNVLWSTLDEEAERMAEHVEVYLSHRMPDKQQESSPGVEKPLLDNQCKLMFHSLY